MKNLILLALLLTSTSVFAKKNKAPEAPPVLVDLNQLKLSIAGKSCNGDTLELKGNETLKTGNGVLMLISKISESEKDYCQQVVLYMRLATASGYINSQQMENSMLTSSIQRTVCRSLETKEVISDTQSELAGKSMTGELAISPSLKTMSLQGSEECPNGILKMYLEEAK